MGIFSISLFPKLVYFWLVCSLGIFFGKFVSYEHQPTWEEKSQSHEEKRDIINLL